MRNPFLILYSLYVWLICFTWMAVICFFTYLLLPIFPYKKTHSWIAAPGFAACMWLIGCPTRVEYDSKFDRERRTVFLQNHVNLLDAFIASKAIPHVFCGLMHRWQFSIPIYGWMMKVSRGIAMEKKQMRNAREYMASEARKRKEDGFSILTFPEGGRTTDGEIHTFKRGVFFMARDAGYPVAPIVVHGNFDVNQKGSKIFRPGKINVFVAAQIETQGMSDDDMGILTHQCEAFSKQKFKEMASWN